MLRALVCLFTLFTVSTSFANDTEIDCTIKSWKYPELTKGMNKATLCRDLTHELRNQFEEKISGSVVAKVTWVERYAIGFKIKAKLNGVKYKGIGQEDWYPGDSYFTIDRLEKR